MVIVFSKIYPACQRDENGFKPGSNLNNADKHVDESSRAECLGIIICFRCLNDSYKNVSRISRVS